MNNIKTSEISHGILCVYNNNNNKKIYKNERNTGYIASDFLNCASKHSTISLKPQEKYKENYTEAS